MVAGLKMAEMPAMWEVIQTADNIRDHVTEHELGKASERETVDARAEAILDSANGAFNFTNVTVGSDNVHFAWSNGLADAFKFGVSMDILDEKATVTVKLEKRGNFLKDGFVAAIRHQSDCAETHPAGDSVQKTVSLDEKEINANSCLSVMLQGRGRNGDSVERGGMGCRT